MAVGKGVSMPKRSLVASDLRSPNWILRDGELLVPPPIRLEIRSLHMFVVAADPAALQGLCDDELNRGSVRYQPVGPFVVFYAADMTNVVPSGVVDEIDIGVWVPVFAGPIGAGRYRAERILAYTPYVWVDSSPALVGGRSYFGFPKHLGALRLSQSGRPASFRVDTWLVDQQGTAATLAPLLRIDEVGAAFGGRGEVEGGLLAAVEGAFAAARSVVDGARGAVSFLGSLPRGGTRRVARFLSEGHGLPGVFLQQLPAADGTQRAVYQAILEVPIPVRDMVAAPRLVPPHEISIRHCFSHRLAERLGLHGGSYSPAPPYFYTVPSLLALSTAFTADVLPGRVMWEAFASGRRPRH